MRPQDGEASGLVPEVLHHVFAAPSELLFALVRLRTDELTGVAESTDV